MSTNDIDIVKLNLNDTFYDWYLRTNQIIDYVNPINVYDVFAGAGLQESRTSTPGTIELIVGTDVSFYGIGTQTNSNGNSEVILDYSALTTGTIANTSFYSFQGSGDQIYKVVASNMLPPEINGNHAFGGTITVADLIVDDGTITLNNTGTNRDNCGLVIESNSNTNTENVYFTFDEQTEAWYSSEYLGVKSGKGFVTDSTPKAVFPFIATQSQGQVDLRLQTSIGSTPEYFSIQGRFDSPNSILFSHYYNNVLIGDILELTSSSTNGSSVIVKDTITITDILNSTPFTQTPEATSVPITSSDGYLNQFVNRVKLPKDGSVGVGNVVRMGASTVVKAQANNLTNSQTIGIVESVDGTDAVVITSGPFSNITGLTGLTTGTIYYLDPDTAGAVTPVNPDNTNGELDKPLFIATSSTSGVLIPDFAGIGGASTVISSGGTINNAFATITGDSGSSSASGEDSIGILGGINITTSINGGGNVVIDSDIPASSTANQLLRRNNSNAYEWFTPSNYSVISKSLNTGEIDSVVLTAGTILGRRDDTDDTDNPVQALNSTQVLDILGFTGNSFIKTITFENGTGSPEHEFNAETSEAVNIRAGANITFEWDGADLYINSSGEGTNISGTGSLLVAKERATAQETTTLVFEDDFNGGVAATTEYIQFAVRHTTGNQALISAKPTNNYLRLSNGLLNGTHTAGNAINFTGSTNGIAVSYTPGLETFNFALNPTITVNKIIAQTNTSGNGLILSGGDDTGRDTLILLDERRNIDTSNQKDESTIRINAFDTFAQLNDTNRLSTYGLGADYNDKAVTIYADSNYKHPDTGETYTYPFRFHKLLVDEIECHSLTANEAIKTKEYLQRVVGQFNDSWSPTSSTINLQTDQLTTSGGENGVTLKFTDEEDSSTARIHFPSVDKISANYANIPNSTLSISNYLMFGSNSNEALFSPTISRGSDSALSITSHQTASVEITLDGNSTGTGKIGTVTDPSNSYSYITHEASGSSTIKLIGGGTPSVEINCPLTIKNSTQQLKIVAQAIPAGLLPGQVLYSSSVTSVGSDTISTISAGYIIKAYNAGTGVLATDPINTLYYSF
jgi:hypothetical protein